MTLPTTNVIERAFQLAAQARGIEEIRATLKQEGYLNVDAHLNGPKIKSDLRRLLDQALQG